MRADTLETLDDVLEREGVHGALRWLNQRTTYRFTGVYRFDPPALRSVRLFDRENPDLEVGADAPMRETYCSITGSGAAPFETPDAQADPRLREHPARSSTLSYCGVPLLDAEGSAVGTLCHFDVVPRSAPARTTELLAAAAPRIAALLQGKGLLPVRAPRPDAG